MSVLTSYPFRILASVRLSVDTRRWSCMLARLRSRQCVGAVRCRGCRGLVLVDVMACKLLWWYLVVYWGLCVGDGLRGSGAQRLCKS